MDLHFAKQTNTQTKMTTLATCWSMVINNPEENDYVLVRQFNKDYIREIAWTTEVGKEGTEHIQAYVRLQKQQRMSFIKKLFPRGHFKAITKDEYDLNTKNYATKNDETTAGLHYGAVADPIPSVDSLLKTICEEVFENYEEELMRELDWTAYNDAPRDQFAVWEELFNTKIHRILQVVRTVEKEKVHENPRVAKLLVSPTYQKLKREWLKEIFMSYMTTYDADDDQVQGNEGAPDEQAEPAECSDDSQEVSEASSEASASDTGSEGSSDEVSEREDGD